MYNCSLLAVYILDYLIHMYMYIRAACGDQGETLPLYMYIEMYSTSKML